MPENKRKHRQQHCEHYMPEADLIAADERGKLPLVAHRNSTRQRLPRSRRLLLLVGLLPSGLPHSKPVRCTGRPFRK